MQYWLFWYYNDWNNKHEGDWEFVQLLFPASTVAEALATDPVSVGYAQHEGGERADWTDDKLEREGSTHPVVYSSQRSHASYFAAALYMGRSGSEGFGCDDTEEPSTRVEPDVVVLPDAVDDPSDPLAWIGFEGRWGERHAAPNNGPTGPTTKPQWTEPVTWHDGLRDSSFVVPTGDTRGTQLIDTFCSVVEWGSVQFVRFVASPARVLFVLALLTALAVFIVRRTSWRSVGPVPLPRRRRAGEIARVAGVLYRRHPGTFTAVGAIAVPVAVVALVVGAVLRRLPLIGDLVTVSDTEGTGGRLVIASSIAALFGVLAFVLISAAVAWIVGGPEGIRPSAGDALQAVAGRIGALAAAFLPAALIIVVLDLAVIGIPIAIWLLVRWQFIPQVTMLEGLSGGRTLARSAELVRKRWWHTALVTLIVVAPDRQRRRDRRVAAPRHLHRAPAVGAVGDHRRLRGPDDALLRARDDVPLRRRRRVVRRHGRRRRRDRARARVTNHGVVSPVTRIVMFSRPPVSPMPTGPLPAWTFGTPWNAKRAGPPNTNRSPDASSTSV